MKVIDMKQFPQKYILALAAALLVAAVPLASKLGLPPFGARPQQASAPTADRPTAAQVGRIKKPLAITRTGALESAGSVPVNADFTGQLSELYVKEGQAVKAGQPLLKLQATQEPALQEPEPAAPSARTQADYEAALKEVNRLQKLYEIGGISRKQFEAATARLQEAKANTTVTASAPATSVPKDGFATLTAPVDGIITGLSATAGKTVQAGQKLLALGSGQEVEAVVRLSQNDLYLIHLGSPAVISSGQHSVTGQVSRIYPQVEAEQAPFFLAHVKLLSSPDGLWKAGLAVTVRLDSGKTADIQAVPTTALFRDNQGNTFVYLAVGGKAHRQQVLVGDAIGGFTEITSELPQPSYVIAENVAGIKDGDPVTIP